MGNVLYLDEESLRQSCILRELALMGYSVRVVATSSNVMLMLEQDSYDCLLVHHGDEQGAGVSDLCLRATRFVRCVVVLMDTVDISLEELLFDCGVCDVVAGPQVSPRLIAKRVNTHLRMPQRQRAPMTKLRLDHVVIDFQRRVVTRDGAEHPLPGILSDLLWYFVCNADHVVSRQELSESAIWAESVCTPAVEGGKTFDVHVSRLRKIIEANPRKPRLIQSVRGVGWKLAIQPVREHGDLPAKDSHVPALLESPSSLD